MIKDHLQNSLLNGLMSEYDLFKECITCAVSLAISSGCLEKQIHSREYVAVPVLIHSNNGLKPCIFMIFY